MTEKRKKVRRALFSVSDKTGLADLAKALHDNGTKLVGTSSTAAAIADAGLPVTEISDVTGFPEILGGRVKTLHPKIHGGVLVQQGDPQAEADIATLDIEPFDMVVVNLYPFEETLASGASPAEVVEMIDIGGPTLVRAAAKNFAHVAVVTDPGQYEDVRDAIEDGGTTARMRQDLAAAAFQLTADYDVGVATWFASDGPSNSGPGEKGASEGEFPAWVGATFRRENQLRYGENPHQGAAVYKQVAPAAGDGLVGATVLGGKELSFNNLRDADAALKSVASFDRPAVSIIKHANPCGLAVADTTSDAYAKALACDPLSAFGGIVASNRQVDGDTARQIAEVFTEVVAAPSFTEDALEMLQAKKALRLLEVDLEAAASEAHLVPGGLLMQQSDTSGPEDETGAWRLVAGPAADGQTLADLQFAWDAVRYVKSNAILLAKDLGTVGIGMGQVNRLDSARLAVTRANTLGDGPRAEGSVAASDAFFPFPDGLQILIDAGVQAVVAPGGSKGDPQVIEAAEAAGLTLYFAERRHFWH